MHLEIEILSLAHEKRAAQWGKSPDCSEAQHPESGPHPGPEDETFNLILTGD